MALGSSQEFVGRGHCDRNENWAISHVVLCLQAHSPSAHLTDKLYFFLIVFVQVLLHLQLITLKLFEMSILQPDSLSSHQEALRYALEASTVCKGLPYSEKDVASFLPRAPTFVGKIGK